MNPWKVLKKSPLLEATVQSHNGPALLFLVWNQGLYLFIPWGCRSIGFGCSPLDLLFHGGFRSWALPLGKTYVPLQPGSNQRIIVLCLLITCMRRGANENCRQILCQAHIIQELHTPVQCLNNESLQWRGIAALICSDKNITSAQPPLHWWVWNETRNLQKHSTSVVK